MPAAWGAGGSTLALVLKEAYLQSNRLAGAFPSPWSFSGLQCMGLRDNPLLCAAPPAGLPCFDYNNTHIGGLARVCALDSS